MPDSHYLEEKELQAALKSWELELSAEMQELLIEEENRKSVRTLYKDADPYNWVTENLAVGDDEHMYSEDVAKKALREGVTHILDCRIEAKSLYALRGRTKFVEDNFVYLNLGIEDDAKPKPDEYWAKVVEFGNEAVKDGGKLLAHCAAGINRGPSAAFAILRSWGYETRQALRMIRQVRPVAYILYYDNADLALVRMKLANAG